MGEDGFIDAFDKFADSFFLPQIVGLRVGGFVDRIEYCLCFELAVGVVTLIVSVFVDEAGNDTEILVVGINLVEYMVENEL